MRTLLTLAALLATTAAPAADLDFDLLDRRIASLEARVASLEGHATHAGNFRDVTKVSADSYAAAYARAVRENLPLVCWVGGGDAVCPACVKTLAGEVVSHVTPTLPGVTGRALVVGVPDGRGGIDQAAVITSWVTGSPEWGHTASIRRAIARWRATRTGVRSGWSVDAAAPAAAYQPPSAWAPAPIMMAAPAPMMAAPRFAPVRRMTRGGNCASCG